MTTISVISYRQSGGKVSRGCRLSAQYVDVKYTSNAYSSVVVRVLSGTRSINNLF